MRPRPTRRRWHFVETISCIQTPYRKTPIARYPSSDLVPLSQVRVQPLLDMRSDFRHFLGAVAIIKIRNPAPERLVDVANHIYQGDQGQLAAGHAGKTAFDPSQGFSGGLHVGVIASGAPAPDYTDLETKKIKAILHCIHHMGLLGIQRQPQTLQNLNNDLHWTLYAIPTKYDKIVRITHQTRAKPRLQLVPLPDPVQ